MYEIHPQNVCCRQRWVLWLSGVLTSVASILSDAIMHVEEPCAILCLYLLQKVHSTLPGGAVCRLLPRFFEIVDIQQFKARCAQIGLEYDPAAGASSAVSPVKDHQVSELVSTNSKCIVT